MPSPRPAAARRGLTLVGAVALLAATGCSVDKPTPIVTVQASGSSTYSGAQLYCFKGQAVAKNDCRDATSTKAAKTLKVKLGDQVGVDVDKAISDKGWYLTLGVRGQQPTGSAGPTKDHYLAFTPDFGQATSPLELQVHSLTSNSSSAAVTGTWTFDLVPS